MPSYTSNATALGLGLQRNSLRTLSVPRELSAPGSGRKQKPEHDEGTRRNMKTRYGAIAVVALLGAIGLGACGGGEPAATPTGPAPAEPVGTDQAGGSLPAGQPLTADQLIGMPLDQAAALVEEAGQQWRVGREDGMDRPLTTDFVPGRVTFTVEDGVVTDATIEEEDAPSG
jgi:hypothetical protein